MKTGNYVFFDSLVVEVTRRCNMHCAHCLRGEAENKDISYEVMDALLRHVDGIGCVTFTGGEPSLNCRAIDQFRELCLKYDIPVDSFYIVTNGKENVEELAVASLRWYSYCAKQQETELCGLALSDDQFHEDIPNENITLLKGLSYFREEDKRIDWDRVNLINEGRAEDLFETDYPKRELGNERIEVEKWPDGRVTVIEGNICLTVDGNLLNTCNCSYAHQSQHMIGDVYHMDDFFDEMVALAEVS